MGTFLAVGTFGWKVNRVVVYMKVRGKDKYK